MRTLATVEKGAKSFRLGIQLIKINGTSIITMYTRTSTSGQWGSTTYKIKKYESIKSDSEIIDSHYIYIKEVG